MTRTILALFTALALVAQFADAFAPRTTSSFGVASKTTTTTTRTTTTPLRMSDDFIQETAEGAQERVGALVESHPVLLFMKGSKLFPQRGSSNTAIQILQSYDIPFHTFDVLSDEAIRSGVKEFWPTIPQLYVAGEFIGGSDIMIELYQTGELGEMIEVAKADIRFKRLFRSAPPFQKHTADKII
jgi:monothiol glutaredoxin